MKCTKFQELQNQSQLQGNNMNNVCYEITKTFRKKENGNTQRQN